MAARGNQLWISTRQRGLLRYDFGSRRWRERGFAGKLVTSITLLPTGRIWVTAGTNFPDTVTAVAYYSDDAGGSWVPSDGGIARAGDFHRIGFGLAADPEDPDRLFVGLSAEVIRSQDGGGK